MKFTGTFTGGTINFLTYYKQLDDYLEKKMLNIVENWLYAVTDLVPIWSGMSQGSLLDVAELVGTDLLITPKEGVDDKSFIGSMQGYAKLTAETAGVITVEISTSVPHYVLQEYENVNVSPTAPWESFAAGANVFKTLAAEVRIPRPVIQPKKYNV